MRRGIKMIEPSKKQGGYDEVRYGLLPICIELINRQDWEVTDVLLRISKAMEAELAFIADIDKEKKIALPIYSTNFDKTPNELKLTKESFLERALKGVEFLAVDKINSPTEFPKELNGIKEHKIRTVISGAINLENGHKGLLVICSEKPEVNSLQTALIKIISSLLKVKPSVKERILILKTLTKEIKSKYKDIDECINFRVIFKDNLRKLRHMSKSAGNYTRQMIALLWNTIINLKVDNLDIKKLDALDEVLGKLEKPNLTLQDIKESNALLRGCELETTLSLGISSSEFIN